ncbi:Protein piccolo [Frankliniella fusca]|uniref:Protein piccolo n=1 Tax=Frankliniella fusca TaxID=407009 RepID=A0AAE1HWZ0_9NEOP|nr:Protein piccolo [Frankliniella fusca]
MTQKVTSDNVEASLGDRTTDDAVVNQLAQPAAEPQPPQADLRHEGVPGNHPAPQFGPAPQRPHNLAQQIDVPVPVNIPQAVHEGAPLHFPAQQFGPAPQRPHNLAQQIDVPVPVNIPQAVHEGAPLHFPAQQFDHAPHPPHHPVLQAPPVPALLQEHLAQDEHRVVEMVLAEGAAAEIHRAPEVAPEVPPVVDDDIPHHNDIIEEDEEDDELFQDALEEQEEILSSEDEEENDDDEADNNPFDQQHDDPPLYNHASLTQAEAMLAILVFCMKHKITGACLKDLLQLLHLFIPSPNLLTKSLYLFKKYFRYLKFPLQFIYYCAVCSARLTSQNDICCQCPAGSGVKYFVKLSVIDQLKKMFLRPGFMNSLSYPQRREKVNENNIEDVYDGEVYKNFIRTICARGVNIHRILRFMWNTDGISIFKSSKFSVWPFFLSILQLPPEERFKKENVVVAGLWFGKQEPHTNLFVGATEPEMSELRRGVQFGVHNQANPIIFNGYIVTGTCDVPAKAHFMYLAGHSGCNSCPKCKVMGEKTERTGNVFAFPNDHARDPRTDQGTWDDANLARQIGGAVNGMSFPSALFNIVYNLISSTSIDVMHCVHLGIVKKLLKLWTHSSFSEEPFSLRAHMDTLDSCIKAIKPPHFTQRLPTSITDCVAYWKATEYRSFLYSYSLPMLRTIMNPVYFHHFSLLVAGLYLLNKTSISTEDLDLADYMLIKFVNDFEELYGLRFMSMNFHLLHHLKGVTKDLGPLWCTSCYGFEDLNGQFTRFVHGTRYVDLQICASLSTFSSVPTLIREMPEGPVKEFCVMMGLRRAKVKLRDRIADGIFSVGNYRHLTANDTPVIISRALGHAGLRNVNIFSFLRMKSGKFLFIAESYSAGFRMCSSVCQYIHNNVLSLGIIKSFVRISRCACVRQCSCASNFYAIVEQLQTEPTFIVQGPVAPFNIPYMCKYTRSQNYVALDVQVLQSVCWNVNVGQDSFAALSVNVYELE